MVGDHVILANNATLAGHVHVGDHAIIGGLSAVHQFVKIGHHTMIGGMSGVENDVIPFGTVMGERAKLAGLNLVGLERRGFEKDQVQGLMKAFKYLFVSEEHSFAQRSAKIAMDHGDDPLIQDMIQFIEAERKRPLCHVKK
jgi:UDP-N-acetylglucosamine acyltransferase